MELKMISKIIQKEKERQEGILTRPRGQSSAEDRVFYTEKKIHKQSLINLKEYIEQYMEFAYPEALERAKEDREELTKMIEAYK